MFNCVGLKLGNYRLVRLVGHGGFADVYLGEHVYLKTEAAIKVLHTRLPDKVLQKFLAEACNHARLNHPNIVHVLDFGIENTIPFLAMHYAPHGTLRQRYPTGTVLEAHTIVSHVKQITSALQYAHNRNIIHRDIKPENMLLSDEDAIMLSDFGLSIALRNLHNRNIPSLFSQGTLTAGTTTYMAPEQFSGTPYYASDQYGLATLVYEWFCGTPPFVGSDLQTAVKHMYKEPPLMREIVPVLDPAIESVVMRALAKNPQQRFASVRDFADALEAVCKPISARIYPLAKELVPSTFPGGNANIKRQPAPMARVMDKNPPPLFAPERPLLFSKTLSTPLSPEQRTLMSFRQKTIPSDPETQSLVMKPAMSASIRGAKKSLVKPTVLVSIKEPEKNLQATEQRVRWILLAIIVFCLSGAITLSLISFTQTGFQPVKKQVPTVVTHMPKKRTTIITPISDVFEMLPFI
ncbi:MAG: serine/threonine protein kinase [Ktedonobacteraceae bacterium]|nr:serine/threonine protein kinase [Ktedonobacteraceae bacterium]